MFKAIAKGNGVYSFSTFAETEKAQVFDGEKKDLQELIEGLGVQLTEGIDALLAELEKSTEPKLGALHLGHELMLVIDPRARLMLVAKEEEVAEYLLERGFIIDDFLRLLAMATGKYPEPDVIGEDAFVACFGEEALWQYYERERKAAA